MQEAPKWLAELYPQANWDSFIKAEPKKIMHITSLGGSAVIVARKKLKTKENPPKQLINLELQEELSSSLFMPIHYPAITNFH